MTRWQEDKNTTSQGLVLA